jgi:signal transduction histidine kinase
LLVLPHFWQTWWFLVVTGVASAAAVSAMVSLAMRRRLHRKLEIIERQRAVERERARIAKDIHDELGASLTRITMLSQSARDELESSPAAAEVDRIYDTARDLTRAMDEIVWAVNPQHDTLDSLATYLGKFAQDFLAAAHIRCRLEMPIHLPSWPLTAEIRHNLFLAFKEALNNAVKHSAATEVRIFVEIAGDLVLLRVEDIGVGFSTNGSNNRSANEPTRFSQGNGLRNMRQRLSEIGGHCEVRSAPGSGTAVTFRVSVGLGKATVMRIDDNN